MAAITVAKVNDATPLLQRQLEYRSAEALLYNATSTLRMCVHVAGPTTNQRVMEVISLVIILEQAQQPAGGLGKGVPLPGITRKVHGGPNHRSRRFTEGRLSARAGSCVTLLLP
jgi:hypothetical protein